MRNLYMNLWDQHASFEKTLQTRFTPPVQTIYRCARPSSRQRWRRLREGTPVIPRVGTPCSPASAGWGCHAWCLPSTSRSLSPRFSSPTTPIQLQELHDQARRHEFTIYPGKLADANTFRIANIGNIQPAEMARFVDVLGGYMRSMSQ